MRVLIGYAALAVIGILALKVLFGLLSIAFSLFWALLWLAALGFIFCLVLRIISPRTADKVKETIKGQ